MDLQIFEQMTGLNTFGVNLAAVLLFCFVMPFILLLLKRKITVWMALCFVIGLIVFFPVSNGFYRAVRSTAADIVYNYGVLVVFGAVSFIGGILVLKEKILWKILGVLLSLASLILFGFIIFIWSHVGL
jgi:hypothetical protein